MLKEIKTEAYEGKYIKETGLSPALKIMEDLSKYVIFENIPLFYVGDVSSNNSKISISETMSRNLYEIKILFSYVKDTPEEELKPLRETFRKHGLEKISEKEADKLLF